MTPGHCDDFAIELADLEKARRAQKRSRRWILVAFLLTAIAGLGIALDISVI